MLIPADVNNILLRKVAFYQLKQCHILQGLNQELQNLPSASFHSAYNWTLRSILAHCFTDNWYIYMFGRLLPCNDNGNFYWYWTI